MDAINNFSNEVAKLPLRVGSITPIQQDFLVHFLRLYPHIKQILETGFHIGVSTATMLFARPDIFVTSFDIFWFDYTRRAKVLLDIYYPSRNLLLAGNSVSSIPTFFSQFPAYKPDLVFIDGGHERPVPFLDMYFIFKNIPAGTWIIVDDYCLEHGMHGVVEAVDECIKEKYIENITIYKYEDRGWITATRSSVPIKYSEKASPEELNTVYKNVESNYPS
jgi:predicted O-methyltransferase YrrM